MSTIHAYMTPCAPLTDLRSESPSRGRLASYALEARTHARSASRIRTVGGVG